MNNDINRFLFTDKTLGNVVYPLSATFNTNGEFETIVGYTNNNTNPQTYPISKLNCVSHYIQIPHIGKIYPGDIIKLHSTDENEYTLDFGWYVTNEGLDLYGWYLHTMNVIKPFYQSYIDTLEVVKFRVNK